jgi:predicted house-cleaning noncanonical NTP pyrophosphatase (MazG superfamily)
MVTTKKKSVRDKSKIISIESKHTTRVIHLATKEDYKRWENK